MVQACGIASTMTDRNAPPKSYSSEQLLGWLFEHDIINVERSALFDTEPVRLRPAVDFDLIEGMLLGLAIGDSLGNTSESMFPRERRQVHGEIRDYLPNRYVDGRAVGLPSDDSQLAFWTLEQMLDDGRLVVEEVARRFASRQIFGIGQAVSEFVYNYRGLEGPGTKPARTPPETARL